jgi:cytidylate kinase
MKNKDIITIDGTSYVGKSTIARELAKLLGFIYVNTGHMYRAVAKYAIEKNISYKDKSLISLSEDLNIEFIFSDKGLTRTIVDNKDLTELLHDPKIVSYSSKVATIAEVREILTEKQRSYSKNKQVIFEGRDLGTIVFPEAFWKFFITATLEVRAKRMKKNLIQREPSKEVNFVDLVPIIDEIDKRDKNRKIAPLRIAEHAIIYDNSDSPNELQDALILQYYINHSDEIINNSIQINKMFEKK